MRSLVLEPTAENIKQTFLQDQISRNTDVFAFVKTLNSIDENYSLALDGKWGSGKTFFVQHAIMVLKTLAKDDVLENDVIYQKLSGHLTNKEIKKVIPIYYDAWKNDNDTDPLLSIIYTICQSVNIQFSPDYDPNYKDTLQSLCALITGRNIKDFFDSLSAKDPLLETKEKKTIETEIHKFFDLLTNDGNRVVIFIDELDRCKPTYAIQLLERVKHYITHENITFVFSTNLTELSCSIKHHYGNEFNGYKYLDKFFSNILTLPSLTADQQNRLLNLNRNSLQELVVSLFIKQNDISLREQLKVILQIRSFTKNKASTLQFHDSKARFYGILQYFLIPFLICLRAHDNELYARCMCGKEQDLITDFFYMKISQSMYTDYLLGMGHLIKKNFYEYLRGFI